MMVILLNHNGRALAEHKYEHRIIVGFFSCKISVYSHLGVASTAKSKSSQTASTSPRPCTCRPKLL